MRRPYQGFAGRMPAGGIIVSAILMGIGAFMLLLSSIMISLLIYIDLTLLLLGSMASFAGIAIFMPASISTSSALAALARSSSSTLRTVLARASGSGSQEALEEIFSLEPQTPTLLNSIKLAIISIVLVILLLLSLFISLPPLARLAMILVGSMIAPIMMITAVYSLVEETRGWLEKHIALELYVLKKVPQDLRGYQDPPIPRRLLISNAILVSLITMGIYMIYSLPISILELNRHIDWHRDYEQKLSEKIG
ncbi:MAG: hypothetical protein QXR14_08965 [Sulfolobales archaeon]